jgi:hypothetical protein
VNPLRRLPTRKLLAMIAGVIVLAGSVTAVAVAALGGAGPIPAAKSLAAAVHDALAGPSTQGVTAEIQFTNNLIDSSSIPAATPLLKGASGRLWASGDGHLRLELQSSRGDTQIMVAPGAFTVYDVASNTVYRGTLPTHTATKSEPAHQTPTLQTISDAINSLMAKVGITGPDPTDIGGAPAYTVTFSPKHAGGLLGSAQLAFDAVNGAPLRFAVYAQGNTSPVIELTATKVSFGKVAPGDLTVTPPASAKVVELTTPSTAATTGKAKTAGTHGKAKATTGQAAVAAALPFKLDSPAVLAGLPQTSVRLLSYDKKPAAVVTYGQHLGAIVVLERQAAAAPSPAKPATSASDSSSGLPTVSINGATGTEIATALGTLLKFDRGGISYVVVGSVTPAAAEAAARGL